MASYLPPIEILPIFDTQVFDTSNTSYLSYSEAKKYFVSYPIAQGTATITDFITGGISYLTPASGSFFNIGTNQVSGGTIRIGPTGVSGVSVHAGNIDCTNNQINNATDAALNNISLGNLQTSGVLNIGTGSRVLTGSGGAINIGTGAGATANPINIGGAGTVTTFTNGLTTNAPIIMPTTTYTPLSTQLGFMSNNLGSNNSSVTFPINGISTGTGSTVIRMVNMPIGLYMVTISIQVRNPSDIVNNTIIPGAITTTNVSTFINLERFNGPSSSLNASYRSCGVFSGGFQVLAASNTYVVNIATLSGTIDCNEAYFQYTRIA
jgi:hypothetical protein